ncbi:MULTISPECIES: hypothetical protein [unclassified Pannonibacter]|uniref:hypothetical protein n=1 Tax=unclassified Pannonibacter TaxID=2627228 RepID=UPI0016475E1D|nr:MULTISPECIES: hypothetical protein [unclassified Pannonibacter]
MKMRDDMGWMFSGGARGATAGLLTLLAATFPAQPVFAQSLPEQIRVQVVPAEPGIRSILVNKRYRPIISRGIEGAVVETVTGAVDPSTVGCQVELEITLENSRVLRESADICASGGAVTVDVKREVGGRPRVVGGAGVTPAPASPSGSSSSSQPAQSQSTQTPAATAPAAQAPQTQPQTQTQPQPQVQTPPQTQAQPQTQSESRPQVQAPVQQSQPAPLPPLDSPVQPAAPVEREWTVTGTELGSTQAQLVHGSAQGADADFIARCTPQSGFITVSVPQTAAPVYQGSPVSVALKSEEFYTGYDATGSDANNPQGRPLPEFTVAATDPVWDVMARKSVLEVIVEGAVTPVSLKGSARSVRLFAAACALPDQIVDPNSNPAMAGGMGDLACAELGGIRSLDGGFRGRMLFRNARGGPIDVFWIDYSGIQQFYARLEPGQVLDQESIISNAWLVTTDVGQCLGIYISREPQQTVVIGQSNAGPIPGQQGLPQGAFTPAPPVQPMQPQAPGMLLPPAPIGNVSTTNYVCTAGIDLQVVYDTARGVAMVTEFGQVSVTLPRVNGGTGFRYESNGYVLQGQRDNVTWSRPGLYDVFCGRG